MRCRLAIKTIGSEALRQIVLEVSPGSEYWLTDLSVDLLEIGAVDSMNIIKIISLLEERYGFVFNVADIKAENFQSIEALMRLLELKYDFKVSP